MTANVDNRRRNRVPDRMSAQWRLVPVEASDGMLQAAWREQLDPDVELALAYRAMLQAAPAPEGLRAAIREIVEGAVNSAIPEPWEIIDHATDSILQLLSGEGKNR